MNVLCDRRESSHLVFGVRSDHRQQHELKGRDPQPTTTFAPDQKIRPRVATGYNGSRTVWLFDGGLLLAAIALFVTLDARRERIVEPATATPGSPGGATISAAPALVVPAGPDSDYAYRENCPQFAPPLAAPGRSSAAYVPAPSAQVIARENVSTVPAHGAGGTSASFTETRQLISSTPSADRPAHCSEM